MKIVARPRGGGKTTEIASLAIKEHGIVLTANTQMARNIERNYPDLKGKVFPFDYFYRDAQRGSIVDKIFIDDIDEVLHCAFGYHTIAGMSFTVSEDTGWDK
jgi:hypothetical protein